MTPSTPPTPSANPRVLSFVRHIRERASFRADHDPPLFDLADSLRAQMRREGTLINLSPADGELIEHEIRRATGT